MIDAFDKAFADADRSLMRCKSASVSTVVSASAGYSNRPLSLPLAREQLLHLRGWVWSAVRLVGQRIAGQRICVGRAQAGQRYKSLGDPIEPLDSHPLLDALAAPNPWLSYWQLAFNTVASLEVTGRAVWWVNRSNEGTQFLFIPTPWIIEIDPLQRWWKIRPTFSTQEFTIPGDEILNLHYPSPEGNHPNEVISPLSRVSESVLTDEKIQIAQNRFMSNGIFPGAVLTVGRLPDVNGMPGQRPTLTPQQRADLIAAVRSAWNGVLSAGDPLILDSIIESVTKFSQNAMELDFGGSSKLTKARVLQAYGVSPILLGELENANRASSVVAEEIFVYHKLNPLIELLSGCLTQWLGPMFASPREKLVIWIEPAKPHDAENSLKQWELGLRMGAVTREEYRVQMLNLAAGKGYDVVLLPVGFIEQGDDEADQQQDQPQKRLNGHSNRLTITAR